MNRIKISDDKYTVDLFYKESVIAYVGRYGDILVIFNSHRLVDAIFHRNRPRFRIRKIDNSRNIIIVKLSGLLL